MTALLVLMAFLCGCTAAAVPDVAGLAVDGSGHAGTVRSAELDDVRPVRGTWERAAVAEARRLVPGLSGASAHRVRFGGRAAIVRVRVTAPGYCHIFGGQSAQGQWQANDLGEC